MLSSRFLVELTVVVVVVVVVRYEIRRVFTTEREIIDVKVLLTPDPWRLLLHLRPTKWTEQSMHHPGRQKKKRSATHFFKKRSYSEAHSLPLLSNDTFCLYLTLVPCLQDLILWWSRLRIPTSAKAARISWASSPTITRLTPFLYHGVIKEVSWISIFFCVLFFYFPRTCSFLLVCTG